MEIFVLLLLLSLSSIPPIFSSSSSSPTPLFPKDALPTKSGYLPISNTSSSSLYFTFYEAQHPVSPPSRTPLLVWLQGGPGCSSMNGNFFELGPWLVTDRLTLERNPASWNRRFGLLFIDSPIGVGFSIAASPQEIPRDQTAVAEHLHVALQHFLSLDSSFRSRPLYVTGESYGGKYVPSVGYYILRRNREVRQQDRINLHGIAIGNGLTHPLAQVKTHAASGYFSGLINEEQQAHLKDLQDEAVKLTVEAKWSEATDARNKVLDWLQNATGLATLYDLRRKEPYANAKLVKFLRTAEAVKDLGVKRGAVWYGCSDVVEAALHGDVMKSVKFMVEEILSRKLKVLLYEGIFDLRDGVVSTEAWVKEMEWEGLQRFLMAKRKVWLVGGEKAGYVQRWGKLSNVVVSGAGHMVPADQGVNSQAMIEDWVQENGLFSVTG